MPAPNTQEKRENSLHNLTINGLQQVIDRSLNYVEGLEKSMMSRGVQMLYPRVEQRIRRATETELRAELQYLHELLGSILKDTSAKKSRKTSRGPRKKAKRK